jgi:hypothetical protein
MPKAIVYNIENPDQREFYLSVNGVNVQGLCGVEIDLKPEYVDVLQHAVIETWEKDKTGNVVFAPRPRYRVLVLGEQEESKPATEQRFVCDKCGREFPNRFALAGHKKGPC